MTYELRQIVELAKRTGKKIDSLSKEIDRLQIEKTDLIEDRLSTMPVEFIRVVRVRGKKLTRRDFSDLLPESCSWHEWDQRKREAEFKKFQRDPTGWIEKTNYRDAARAVWNYLTDHRSLNREGLVDLTIDAVADKLLNIALEHVRDYSHDDDKSIALYEGVRLHRAITESKDELIEEILSYGEQTQEGRSCAC